MVCGGAAEKRPPATPEPPAAWDAARRGRCFFPSPERLPRRPTRLKNFCRVAQPSTPLALDGGAASGTYTRDERSCGGGRIYGRRGTRLTDARARRTR